MKLSIRGSMIAIALLGLATCALALYSLGRPLAMANERRTERAREAVAHEVDRLRESDELVDTRARANMFGLRSGFLDAPDAEREIAPPLDPAVGPLLQQATMRAEATADVVTMEENAGSDVVFIAAARTPTNRIAWATYLMHPPQWTPTLRIVGAFLVLTSLGLVFVAVLTIRNVQRGAQSMLASLRALGKDLSAPVPVPAVTELADVSGGIARLATELSEAQIALAERERLAVLGRVTAGVAHEVRNPLAAIKLRIDMARRSDDVSPALASDLHDIGDEVDRLNRLVTDLLVVAGRKAGPRTDEDLGALVRRRVELLEPLASARRVSVRIDGDGNAAVEADAFARAIDNLLRNAIEASPAESEVRVEVAAGEDGATIRVRDPGPGVEKPREAELFEPFFTTKPDGVGLGLALTKAIAESHGGRLTYRREAAVTLFELSIPLEAAA